MGMRCSVVIPCYNGAELTRACIQSLLEQDLPVAEVLIVDNNSEDHTCELDQLDERVRVLQQERNLGFAGGVNAGIRQATGDHVLILNNDTLSATNMLRELHRTLHSAPNIGAAAPMSNHVKGDALLPVGDFGRVREQRQELANELQGAAPLQDADTLAGLCLLLERETLTRVGLFDERFGHGNYEDDDLCLRMRLRGYRLAIARRAFLHHEGHATFRSMGLDLKEQIAKRFGQFRNKWLHHPAGLATLAGLQHDYGLAASAALIARRRAPNFVDADWHIGRFHERSGDAQLAVQHLRSFLQACPEHVEARLMLGLALIRSGQNEQGQRVLTNTLQHHQPSTKQEVRMLQRLAQFEYEAGQHQRALEHLHTALAVDDTSAELYNWLGLCELGLDHVPAARTAFAAACKRGHALAHTNLGICQSRLGEQANALRSFEQAAILLPHDPIARANYQAMREAQPT